MTKFNTAAAVLHIFINVKRSKIVAGKLKITPLGGIDEIGKNITVFESGSDIIVVDCGLAFPDNEVMGVDVIIPDMQYLEKHKNRVKGIFITHGHEDHIGALPFLTKTVSAPIYATPFTAGLIQNNLEESGTKPKNKIVSVNPGESVQAGVFRVEFIHVNHSIPDSVSFAIDTPQGKVVITGDYKIDPTPIGESMCDLARFGELGKAGVLLLMSDSTNADKEGYTLSEKSIGDRFDAFFANCNKRIIVATFASNVARIQQVLNAASKYGRRVAISGRSMEKIIKIAQANGNLKVPSGVLCELSAIKKYPSEKTVIVVTGSQGETMSSLYRIAFSTHKQISVNPDDKIIISATPIPGNEIAVSKVINELFRRGAQVHYERSGGWHVSGHACKEEQKMLISLVKPKYFMPIHGEQRHLRIHAQTAVMTGVAPKNILIPECGKTLEVTKGVAKFKGNLPTGKIFIDGNGSVDVNSMVIRDRKYLSENGMLTIVVALDAITCEIISGPDVVSRGFGALREDDAMICEIKNVTVKVIEKCLKNGVSDWATIKSTVKQTATDVIYKKYKKKPMVLPVIMEI